MNWDSILALIFTILQGVVPPFLVTWTAGLVKKWKESLTPKQITGLVVPAISLAVSILDYFIFGANYIWTFILGMGGIAIYEIKKNFTDPDAK